MYITCLASDATNGLSPTVRIRKISDSSLVVTNAAMTDMGDGGYSYDFSTAEEDTDYWVRVDFGSTFTGQGRYQSAQVSSRNPDAPTVSEIWNYDVKQSSSSTAGDKLNKLPVGVGILGQQGKTKFELEKEKELLDAVKKIGDDVEELKKKETVIEREIEIPDISSPIVQKMEEIGRKMKQELKTEVRSEVLSAVDEAVSASLERDEDESMEMESEEALKNAMREIETESAMERIEELAKSVAKALEQNKMLAEENAKLNEKLSKLKETLA